MREGWKLIPFQPIAHSKAALLEKLEQVSSIQLWQKQLDKEAQTMTPL